MELLESLATILLNASFYKDHKVKNKRVKNSLILANDIYFEYYNTIEPYFAFRMG